ncbi:replication-relaxation family protein [Streptomyces sp. NPDC001177]
MSASAGPRRSAPDESAHHEDQGASRAQLRGPGFPEVYHSGSGEAVIPDALLYYRDSSDGGAMLRAFVEVDRATMGPERLAAKLTAYFTVLAAPLVDLLQGGPSAPVWHSIHALGRRSPGACPGTRRQRTTLPSS